MSDLGFGLAILLEVKCNGAVGFDIYGFLLLYYSNI